MQSEKELTPNQKNLVNLMTTMVQKYYRAANLSSEETELAVIANIEEIQMLMGKIAANITIQQNEKISKAIEEADKAPYSAY